MGILQTRDSSRIEVFTSLTQGKEERHRPPVAASTATAAYTRPSHNRLEGHPALRSQGYTPKHAIYTLRVNSGEGKSPIVQPRTFQINVPPHTWSRDPRPRQPLAL